MKAILLVGGFGTRLKHLVPDVPKPMASIAGRPFLEYLLDNLSNNGITEAILSVHYLKEKIIDHFGDKYKNINLLYAIEDEPLGTGGAILNSMKLIDADEEVIVMNGDSYQPLDFRRLFGQEAHMTVVLRAIKDTSRYGRIEIDGKKIISFSEKGVGGAGYINAGCYAINSKWFLSLDLPEKFSFENDFMAKYVNQIDLAYLVADDYFIDIGIPEDYLRAQHEIPNRVAQGFVS